MYLLITILILVVLYVYYIVHMKFVLEKIRLKLLEDINGLIPEVSSAFGVISQLFRFGHYLTESERKIIVSRYSELDKAVKRIIKSKVLKDSDCPELFRRFHNAIAESEKHKEENNERFKELQLDICKEYFYKVLTYPLDE